MKLMKKQTKSMIKLMKQEVEKLRAYQLGYEQGSLLWHHYDGRIYQLLVDIGTIELLSASNGM